MWNHYTHLEAYFGVPAAGGPLHTLNRDTYVGPAAAIHFGGAGCRTECPT
jgi:hypothetical protein